MTAGVTKFMAHGTAGSEDVRAPGGKVIVVLINREWVEEDQPLGVPCRQCRGP